MKAFFSVLVFSFLLLPSGFSQLVPLSDTLLLRYLYSNNFENAQSLAEEYAANLRGTKSENTLEFANALHNLSLVHFYQGNYYKAKYYIQKEVLLRESLSAMTDLNYLKSLENASIIFRKAGFYNESLEFIKKAEKKSKGILDIKSSEYADLLASFAAVYNDMGCAVSDAVLIKKAKEYFEKADEIYTLNGEKSVVSRLINKSNFAVFNNNIGNTPFAETLLKEVISESMKIFGQNSLFYSSAINNLGVFYYNNANYKQAEIYFNQAIEIVENSNENKDIQHAICLSNLGAFYDAIGNYELAASLFQQSKSMMEKEKFCFHPNYAYSLNNLAMANLTRQYYTPEEKQNQKQIVEFGHLLLKSDTLFEQNCKLPHPQGTILRLNISVWYKMMNETKKSLQLANDQATQSNMGTLNGMITKFELHSSLRTFNYSPFSNVLNPIMIPISIKTMDNLKNDSALINNTLNQSLSTIIIMRMMLGDGDMFRRKLGPYHPKNALILMSLADLYWSIGDLEMEEKLRIESINILNHNILQDFAFLSESEKEMYLQMYQSEIHSFTEYCVRRKWRNPSITGIAYNQVLQNKGLMLKSSTAMRLAILNSHDTSLLNLYDSWILMQKEISALYSTPPELRTKDIKSLETKANKIEKSLVESSQTFNDFRKSRQITWQDVKKSLKPNEAAIEFTDYKVKNRYGINKTFYCALMVKQDSRLPILVKIFEESDLLAILGNNAENNLLNIQKVYGTNALQNERLYNLIWKPIEKYLNGVNYIYLSPTGLLHKVSFAAISSGKNIYLCDLYQIRIKGSTGSSVFQSSFSENNQMQALVFGGIQYGNDSSSNMVWNYLKGTKNEGEAVRELLEKKNVKVNYLTETEATETSLKQNAQKCTILHVATHGFFFPDPNEVRVKDSIVSTEFGPIAFRGTTRALGVNSFVNNLNPLMRSGLVFAGANSVWSTNEIVGVDDGVLTAQEVTQIDMRNNDLVVLSACETGLGDIKGNEGVYGLQRAFKMAGVKFIIMSLWQVPDKETEEFMILFYSKLFETKDIRLAFSKAQEEMRKKYDPYYWAAFVLME